MNFWEIKKHIGLLGILKHYIKTPFLVAIGMDFYLSSKKEQVVEKVDSIWLFIILNFILTLPLWIITTKNLLYSLVDFILILLLFVGLRYIGNFFNKDKWKFRINNGGGLITIIVSIFGNFFPMNANLYPKKYDKTIELKKRLAIPELVKWIGFSLLVLLIFTQNLISSSLGKIASSYLIFMIIPFYPFESFGEGRIYNYNKKVWFLTCIISIIELIVVFNLQ